MSTPFRLTATISPGVRIAPQRLLPALGRAMNDIVLQMEADVRAPLHEGNLRASIGSAVSPQGAGFDGHVFASVAYAPYVEYGTRPHWAPIEPLRRWAAKHDMNPYALRRTIAQRGTQAHPYMQPALEQWRPRLDGVLGRLVLRYLQEEMSR